jgi:hypothetical protein
MRKPNVVIRMGASHWDVKVFVPSVKDYVEFDMRKMTGRQRSDFHREFMNAFRQGRK